jgi:hypothetical protein
MAASSRRLRRHPRKKGGIKLPHSKAGCARRSSSTIALRYHGMTTGITEVTRTRRGERSALVSTRWGSCPTTGLPSSIRATLLRQAIGRAGSTSFRARPKGETVGSRRFQPADKEIRQSQPRDGLTSVEWLCVYLHANLLSHRLSTRGREPVVKADGAKNSTVTFWGILKNRQCHLHPLQARDG